MSDRPDTLAAALALAKFGFHVFDVDHPDLPKCVGVRTEEHDPDTCVERGKHPACKWSVQATTDPKRITAMFAGRTRNIGIACGPSRILVIDEDAPEEFAKFCADVGQPVPDTFRSKTGKGWHHYFRAVDGLELGNHEGTLRSYAMNVRGVGGYVVGPGSVHGSGHVYVVGEAGFREILPLPQFLVDALTGATSSAWDQFTQPSGSERKDHSWWRDPDVIHHGNRHHAIIAAAGWCLSLGIPRDDAVTVVRDVWRRSCRGSCCRDEHGKPAQPYSWDRALARLDDVYRRYPPGEPRSPNGETNGRTVRLTPASAIKPRPVRWLWQDRIPAGEFTITPGRGGLGKSTFHVRTAADITNGMLPGIWFGTPKPVIIAATEDSWSRTIVPRLMAAGANMDLVFRADVVTEIEEEEYTLILPRDIAALEKEITRIGAVMLSVDPLLSALDGLDSHKDAEVRQALQPLARMADRTGCAVLGNAHFNKSGGSDPLALVMGSAAFGNVARAALGFARDTEADDDSCVISQVKNNLGRLDLPSLRYKIEGVSIDTDEGPAEIGHLVWLGESDRSVADILRDRGSSAEDRSDLDEAAEWLVMFITDMSGTGYAPAVEVLRAGMAAGFAKHTLQRARKRAGIRTTKADFGGGWVWVLPEGDAQGDEGDVTRAQSSSSPWQSSSSPFAEAAADEPEGPWLCLAPGCDMWTHNPDRYHLTCRPPS